MTDKCISAQEALRKYFGYDTFRPYQAEIIEAVQEGHDCLVLMPTGRQVYLFSDSGIDKPRACRCCISVVGFDEGPGGCFA